MKVPFLFLLVLTLLPIAPLYALQVKKIDPKTQELALDNGSQIRFAGLILTPEAPKVLAVIFSKSDVQINEEKSLFIEGAPPAVYLYLKTSEIDFPSSGSPSVREPSIFLNEMLLRHGLATVDESVEFSRKESFLKIQDEARLSGMGIWSQEPPKKKS